MEMCQREGCSLQRGMNFRLHGRHSVILMSVRPGAPYHDKVLDGGTVLIYEGHDVPKSGSVRFPKQVDQLAYLPSGTLTENGKFHQAAQAHKTHEKGADLVRVYEKIKPGIWSDNGYFELIDSWQEADGHRNVFKFRLKAIETEIDDEVAIAATPHEVARRRIIPTAVKLEVWRRDGGRCIECGAIDELHFDHILPFSKGGTSITPENVQLLCARHNLSKHDHIQ